MKPDLEIGYCGNVHPALTLEQVIENITLHAASVRNAYLPAAKLPYGIWISETALNELEDAHNRQRLIEALSVHDIIAFTVNGFPFGDFHQPVVKHSVYHPDWTTDARLDYTLKLARLHDHLLPTGQTSTISTLPLGWPSQSQSVQHGLSSQQPMSLDKKANASFLTACAKQLLKCVRALIELKQQTGRHCIICLEPEPGCVLDNAHDVCRFFEEFLFANGDADSIKQHIGVCHDICHSAVMFEDQSDAIETYTAHGITVGKVQVSSAVEADFTELTAPQRAECLQALSSFSEPKYLHQTSISTEQTTWFYQDLGDALKKHQEPEGIWRVHFHVPIFASRLGTIGTTQAAISECIEALQACARRHPNVFVSPKHFEVETYAWNVLPAAHRGIALTNDIASELSWFRELVDSR